MDLIITTILQYPYIWNYDRPLNLFAMGSFFLGLFLQFLLLKKSWKFLLISALLLVASLCCEYLYQTIRGMEAFGPAIFGMFTYLAFFGSLLGVLWYFVWTKVRDS